MTASSLERSDALGHFDGAEAQAREAPGDAGIDLRPCDDRQPVGERARADILKNDVEHVGVGVGEVVREDHHPLAR